MVQTVYPRKQPIGLHGGWYAAHEAPDVTSYSAEVDPANPIKNIPFGTVVSLGTKADSQVVLGGAAFFAIAIRSIEREQDPCNPEGGYREKDTVACMRSGYAYITCPEGCLPDDPVDFDPADGTLHNGGGGTVIPGATWEMTAVAGELGVVRIRPI